MTQLYNRNNYMNMMWSDSFDQNCGIICPDPEELFADLYTVPRSICDDINLLKSRDHYNSPDGEFSDTDDPLTSEPEIRNYNCMWSAPPANALTTAPCTTSSATASADSSIVPSPAVPLAAITGSSSHKAVAAPADIVIKAEPIDEPERQQQQTMPRQTGNQQTIHQLTSQQSMQKIPPGTSLLLNSRKTAQQIQQQQQQVAYNKKIRCNSNSTQVPTMLASDFLRDRELMAATAFGRPDTPPSLDDDATEFKHSLDLTACVMGSNNISLLDATDSDKTMAINRLREQLEDTNKTVVFNYTDVPKITDVLSIIKKEEEEDESFYNRQYGFNSSSQQQNSIGDSDFSDDASSFDEDAISSVSKRSGCSSSMSFSANPIGGSGNAYPMKHSDHSYTRSKDGISPSLETPSDSDEEIDVVSIGDKKLPTNPSDKDRRALQTKVAHKFSTARIVKHANGIRTIPPRRRTSYELPYTPSSDSPVKSALSLVNSRYPSPASTPYSSSQYSSSSSSSSSSKYHSSLTSSRKRIAANNCSLRTGGVIINGSNSDEFMPPSKRHRGKKQKTPASNIAIKRHCSVDEVDTIEKRNLHNDMERQRRIGLKNLFEALKKQIPSIKDKERAPKVNILREAAKLCENLTREEAHLSEQKEMLREQLKKRQLLFSQLKMKHNAARGC